MWGQGPGWRSHQRSVEELVRAETRNGPSGAPPRRPRTSMGASGVLGFVLVLVLFVLASDCAGEQAASEPTVSPTTTLQAELAVRR